MHFVKFSRDVSQNYISKGLNLFKADTKTNIINNRPSDKSGFYFQAETLFPRDCWQREAVQSPGEQHRGVARAVQEESQVHDAWRLVSAGMTRIALLSRPFLFMIVWFNIRRGRTWRTCSGCAPRRDSSSPTCSPPWSAPSTSTQTSSSSGMSHLAPVVSFFWGFDLVATVHTINPCLCDTDI